MPFVNIKIAGKLSKEKKAELGKEITKTVNRVTGKPVQYIWVHIEDSAMEDWTIQGEQL
jgi:4-oxalocrotonate tautomerase